MTGELGASDIVAALDRVSHGYGKVTALKDIDLAIPAGRMAGLIGPDGAGKSTLLGLIAGTKKLQAGAIRVLGGNIADEAHRRQCYARIAFMPQGLGRNLYPTLTVAENLHFFGRLYGQGRKERQERITELLRATGLDPFPDRPVGKLSGGMKQKLGLCCALIHDPDLLILDEPTTGIDPLSRRQFWDLIDHIRARRSGMSVLVATAYMEEAERFDWLAAMSEGRVISTGTAAEFEQRTGAARLEEAFIQLLPEEKRAGHQPVVLPPRGEADGVPAIEATDLTCRFGDFTAVDRVSFQIQRGEIFGFLGSNGCGKTTTMKMLTGLLPASAGEAKIFGRTLDAGDLQTRRHVGYMSQSFSLYSELTVRQNLRLHAQLFHLPAAEIEPRIAEMLQRFGLAEVADALAPALPLGVRQRLSLAVALIHKPDLLILDEPTSGVDPVARDEFWRYLIDLSRRDGVTIFISTHFMHEAERCDRISLMHAGRVLAVGTPGELAQQRGGGSLDDAFVAYLQEAAGPAPAPAADSVRGASDGSGIAAAAKWFSFDRLAAFALRELTEIQRDPIRLAFALLGPLILLVTFGFGISFDVERLPFAVLDSDRTPESRELIQALSGSRYFVEQPELNDIAELEHRLQAGAVSLAIEIPSGFGRDVWRDARPEISVWLDGATPFRAETARGYLDGLMVQHAAELARRQGGDPGDLLAVTFQPRLPFNPSFESVYAITPGVIMLLLAMIPAMMTALGVVREKEIGSIANFHATPVSRLEYLAGKQAPYIGIALLSFFSQWLTAILIFGIDTKGAPAALIAGALIYVMATTAFGLLVSTFVRTQIAAIFAAAIIIMIPAANFSGFLTPVSSLDDAGRLFGLAFPSAWFQQVSLGVFVKGLDWPDLWPNHLVLVGFALLYLALAILLLRKQEA
ncbi:MAG TPA: ribosome-associated ATPase/putative transporter RbbA [Dongiaceae bacterium]|nr:ribosome-associated ATPase/putative transporter RbbA [Dongiaceae bacterium]